MYKQFIFLSLVISFGLQAGEGESKGLGTSPSSNAADGKPRSKKKVPRRVTKKQTYKLSPREQFWALVGAAGVFGLALLAIFYDNLPRIKFPYFSKNNLDYYNFSQVSGRAALRSLATGPCKCPWDGNYECLGRILQVKSKDVPRQEGSNGCWYHSATVLPRLLPLSCGLSERDAAKMRSHKDLRDFVLAISGPDMQNAIRQNVGLLAEVYSWAEKGEFGSASDVINVAKIIHEWISGDIQNRKQFLGQGAKADLYWNFLQAVVKQKIVVIEQKDNDLQTDEIKKYCLSMIKGPVTDLVTLPCGQEGAVAVPIWIPYNLRHWFCLVVQKNKKGEITYQTYDSLYSYDYSHEPRCHLVQRMVKMVQERVQAGSAAIVAPEEPIPEAPVFAQPDPLL